jgi:hypothetical protein
MDGDAASLRAKRGNPQLASCLAMTARPMDGDAASLRAKRGNPQVASCLAVMKGKE